MLGFGSYYIIDGYQAGEAQLADEHHLRTVMTAWAQRLEPHIEPGVVLVSARAPQTAGVSVGVNLPESHLALHTFPDRRNFSAQIFSRRIIAVQVIIDELKSQLGMGRFESHLGTRSKTFPANEAALRQVLLGDRDYADARLDESLLAFRKP